MKAARAFIDKFPEGANRPKGMYGWPFVQGKTGKSLKFFPSDNTCLEAAVSVVKGGGGLSGDVRALTSQTLADNGRKMVLDSGTLIDHVICIVG